MCCFYAHVVDDKDYENFDALVTFFTGNLSTAGQELKAGRKASTATRSPLSEAEYRAYIEGYDMILSCIHHAANTDFTLTGAFSAAVRAAALTLLSSTRRSTDGTPHGLNGVYVTNTLYFLNFVECLY